MRQTKIGILTDNLNNGTSCPSYSVYISNLLQSLGEIDRVNEYYLIHHSKKISDFYPQNKDIQIQVPPFGLYQNSIWRYLILPHHLRKMDLDVLHDPCGIGPLLLNNLPYKRVITIHSLISLVYKAYGLSANDNPLGVLAYKLMGTHIRKVEHVIAISSCIKQELINYLAVPEDKITVIHHGVKDIFKPLPDDDLFIVRTKYSLNQPYILYVGVLENRKNVLTLIKAYSSIKEHYRLKHHLVLVGPKGVGSESIFHMVEQKNLSKEIHFLGYVPLDDLPAIYNLADVFVFPSIYEPFGLPPIEAMACGTPVIASNTGGLPEVVGDAGILVNPLNVNEITAAIWLLLSNQGLRKGMINKGLQRAKLFNWKDTAKATLKIYQDLN